MKAYPIRNAEIFEPEVKEERTNNYPCRAETCGEYDVCKVRLAKEKQTNEEYMRSCTTEQLVDAIFDCTMANSWNFSKNGIKRWLKQPHQSVTVCNE